MEPSIFTRIIRGELPCHKVYEDDHTIAFLDINPGVHGHTLVVPKTQVDRLEDLPSDDYDRLMAAVHTVARKMAAYFGRDYRQCVKIEGFDVPHVHVHILPCRTPADFKQSVSERAEPDHEALAKLAQELAAA